jgi:hypothetical protein
MSAPDPARPADGGSGFAEDVAQQHPEGGTPGSRKEVGDSQSSHRHPPHVPQSEADSALQDEHDSPEQVPAMPANASGTDKVSTAEQNRPIEPTSMYDRRPEEDKNSPPSDRVDGQPT